MVDMTALSAKHGSPEANAQLKKRRFAELRLRFYGIFALSLAGLALVALLWSVVGKAALVVSESYITLDVALPADKIDPDNIRATNFDGIRKNALKAAFPSVKDRRARRALYDLTSGGSSFALQDAVTADPSLIGQSFPFAFLASDDVDLYLKGEFGDFVKVPHAGQLSLVVTDDTVELRTSENDFSGILEDMKQGLIETAALLRVQAARQENGRRVSTERAQAAESEEVRNKRLADAQTFGAERDRLNGLADDLEKRARQPGGTETLSDDQPSLLIRVHGGWIRVTSVSDTVATGTIARPLSSDKTVGPSEWDLLLNRTSQDSRKISDDQAIWIESLKETGAIAHRFNWRFLTAGDSREAELAGIWGAAVGSFWTMLVTFCLAFPIGVGAAIYLEEFAPKNRFTDLIEVNINNLAAVPSIVFGLLGLAVFLNVFGVPRSAPLAGGIVLALMTLPTIIIASRAAVRAVPPSIRDAALGIGASRLQTVFHHVVPLAMPGILTGTIIGMAQALGETAPLIMIGMVAFIVDVPGGITEPATALPVQVFRWSDFPERAFEAKTAAAICVLLIFLVIMNAIAVFLRNRFERRW